MHCLNWAAGQRPCEQTMPPESALNLFSSLLLPIWDFPKSSLNAKIRHDIIIKNTGLRSAGNEEMDSYFDKQLRLGE
jgi:hypothetical protein